MKSNNNEKRKGVSLPFVIVSGILMLGAMAGGAAMYAKTIQDMENHEQDLAALDRLVQARKFNLVIQDLNRGKIAEARQFLSSAFASDLREANKMTVSDARAAAEVKTVLGSFARNIKAHPEYYEMAELDKPAKNLQIARHDLKAQ